jgi:hypothetical protein
LTILLLAENIALPLAFVRLGNSGFPEKKSGGLARLPTKTNTKTHLKKGVASTRRFSTHRKGSTLGFF